jgi:hypothetical protein
MRALWLAPIALYVLHQDVWFWRSAQPFVFGVLPVGLAWHAGLTLATAVVMALLVRHAWPDHLDRGALDAPPSARGTRG